MRPTDHEQLNTIMQQDNPTEILFYGTPTCPMVPPVRGILRRANAPFRYIDISRDAAGRQHVRELSGGYESVPTLVFADGSTLVEPSRGELGGKLKTLGYHVRRPNLWQALTENPLILLLAGMFLILGLVGGEWWLAGIGLLILATNVVYARFA